MIDLPKRALENELAALRRDIDRLQRNMIAGTAVQYEPVLTASVTDPTLGTIIPYQQGRYTRLGDLVLVSGYIQFGTVGVNAGSGDYRISLPFANSTRVSQLLPPDGFDSDMPRTYPGRWVVQIGNVTVAYPHLIEGQEYMRGAYPAAAPTGAETFVTHATPAAFTNSSSISFSVIYFADPV